MEESKIQIGGEGPATSDDDSSAARMDLGQTRGPEPRHPLASVQSLLRQSNRQRSDSPFAKIELKAI